MSVSVSVSVSEFVFVRGSGLAVFRFAWVESVGSQSGQARDHGAGPVE